MNPYDKIFEEHLCNFGPMLAAIDAMVAASEAMDIQQRVNALCLELDICIEHDDSAMIMASEALKMAADVAKQRLGF